MNYNPISIRRRTTKEGLATRYASAIGAGALAGAQLGPIGAIGGAVGMAAGCALDYWHRGDDEWEGPEEVERPR